jgi:CRISPR type III-B/RAMP module RAMP protein Cmr1
LNEIQLLLEAVSPMFLYGARQSEPELRGAPFRGQLRYWFRTFNPGLSIQELNKAESLVFGSTDIGSRMDIIVKARKANISPKHVLPHRGGFRLNAFDEESKINFLAYLKNQDCFEPFLKSLLLFLNLGGVGRRARRGFGSLQVLSGTAGMITKDLGALTDLLFPLDLDTGEDLIEHIGHILEVVVPQNIRSSMDMSAFPQNASTARYPSFTQGSWVVLVCNNAFPNYEQAMRDFWQHHLRRNGIRDDYAFGHTINGRRASPFHLHLTKTDQGYHCVLTAFKASPEPSHDFWEKHYALFESCLNAYGGKIFSSEEGDEHA